MIELEEHGTVTLLRMAAGSGNALNLEFTQALDACLQRLERGPAKAVVLTGMGKMFGAGVDLPARDDGDRGGGHRRGRRSAFAKHNQPVGVLMILPPAGQQEDLPLSGELAEESHRRALAVFIIREERIIEEERGPVIAA